MKTLEIKGRKLIKASRLNYIFLGKKKDIEELVDKNVKVESAFYGKETILKRKNGKKLFKDKGMNKELEKLEKVSYDFYCRIGCNKTGNAIDPCENYNFHMK